MYENLILKLLKKILNFNLKFIYFKNNFIIKLI